MTITNWRVGVAAMLVAAWGTRAQVTAPLSPVGSIPLPGVSGRIDHLAFDEVRRRLFVAALENNTVEVIDLAKGAHLRSLTGFHEPQGIATVPDVTAVAIANGGTGTLQLIDAQNLQTRWTVDIGGDADNVRYDAAAKRLYVAAAGGLYAVDPANGRAIGRVAIDGHPESFQLETKGPRIFANLPGMLGSRVIAADRRSMAATARWTPECASNYPMAFDESTGRLFIGCRRPSRVGVIDTASGKSLGTADVVGDSDDMFFDAARQRLYVIGGEGFVDVLQRAGDRLTRAGRVTTRDGARTGLWVPSLARLYVAVPARRGQPAEIRIFASE